MWILKSPWTLWQFVSPYLSIAFRKYGPILLAIALNAVREAAMAPGKTTDERKAIALNSAYEQLFPFGVTISEALIEGAIKAVFIREKKSGTLPAPVDQVTWFEETGI